MDHITNKKRKGSQQLLHFGEKNSGSTRSLLWPNFREEPVSIMGTVQPHSGDGGGNRHSPHPQLVPLQTSGTQLWHWREELWRRYS